MLQQYIMINDVSQDHLAKRVQNFINLFEREGSVEDEFATTLTATIFSYQEDTFIVRLSRTIDEVTFLFLGYHIRFPGTKNEAPNVRGWLTIPEDSISLESLRGRRCLFRPKEEGARLNTVVIQYDESNFNYRFQKDRDARKRKEKSDFEEEKSLDLNNLTPVITILPNSEAIPKSYLYVDPISDEVSFLASCIRAPYYFFEYLIAEFIFETVTFLFAFILSLIVGLVFGC